MTLRPEVQIIPEPGWPRRTNQVRYRVLDEGFTMLTRPEKLDILSQAPHRVATADDHGDVTVSDSRTGRIILQISAAELVVLSQVSRSGQA